MKNGLNIINTYVCNAQAGETVPLAVTATSGNVKFFFDASAKNNDVLIFNAGTKTAFITFGVGNTTTATVPATTGTINAIPILAGAIMTLQKNSGSVQADTCAAICGGADSTTLYFTSIQGS